MPTQLQLRRGTTTANSNFVGASGEITVDTTKKTVVVQDGATLGGFPLLREDVNNLAAGAIGYSKLTLTNSIVNADVNSAAAIAYSKLSLSGSIVNADINASAAIAYSKLSLSDSIVNADINASAAIADTKLATISTAGKVAITAVPLASQIQAETGTDNTVLMTPLRVMNVFDKKVGVFTSQSAGYVAVSGDRIFASSSGGAFSITLPATPAQGDFVQVFDRTGSFATNNVTMLRNGSNIVGVADNLVLNVNFAVVTLQYSGNATTGWLVK